MQKRGRLDIRTFGHWQRNPVGSNKAKIFSFIYFELREYGVIDI